MLGLAPGPYGLPASSFSVPAFPSILSCSGRVVPGWRAEPPIYCPYSRPFDKILAVSSLFFSNLYPLSVVSRAFQLLPIDRGVCPRHFSPIGFHREFPPAAALRLKYF